MRASGVFFSSSKFTGAKPLNSLYNRVCCAIFIYSCMLKQVKMIIIIIVCCATARFISFFPSLFFLSRTQTRISIILLPSLTFKIVLNSLRIKLTLSLLNSMEQIIDFLRPLLYAFHGVQNASIALASFHLLFSTRRLGIFQVNFIQVFAY